jgi:hypothetical protein
LRCFCSCVVFLFGDVRFSLRSALQVEVQTTEANVALSLRNGVLSHLFDACSRSLDTELDGGGHRHGSIVGRALHVPQVVAHLVRIPLHDVKSANRTGFGVRCRNVVCGASKAAVRHVSAAESKTMSPTIGERWS